MPAKPACSKRWAISRVARRRPGIAARLTAGIGAMGYVESGGSDRRSTPDTPPAGNRDADWFMRPSGDVRR